MWLRNDVLKVFFDEHRGGMPVRDSFGFIEAASIEIANMEPVVIFNRGVARLKVPFFQSLNDRTPHIAKHSDSEFVASGAMRRGKDITPHTYEMTATLEGNKLNLAYRLNANRTEKITHSKIWLWANHRLLQKCKVSGKIVDKDLGRNPRWDLLYDGKQPETPITLFGSGSRLEVSGSTNPPTYTMVYRFKEYPKLEVVYGWARDILPEGTYLGNLALTYG